MQKSLWKICRVAIYVCYFTLFGVQMTEVWKRYADEDTIVSVKQVVHQSMTLPTLTICPRDVFKKVSKDIKEVYKASDIFPYPQKVSKKFKMKDLKSGFYGQCQSLQAIKAYMCTR